MTTDSVETCRNVSNWLMKRLSDNSAHVKRKVLLIIKYVAKSGESDFARNVVLHSEEIKKCTSKKEKEKFKIFFLNSVQRTYRSYSWRQF